MKKLLPLILIICVIFVSCGSQQQPETKHITATSTVYWVASGKVYHVDKNCTTLSRSKSILSGTVLEAKGKGKSRMCEVCGNGVVDDT